MNRTYLMLILLLLSSCNNQQSSSQEIPFKEVKSSMNGFYVKCVDQFSDPTTPSTIGYIYKAEVVNNSDLLYESVDVVLEVQLELENGNILTKQDYSSGTFDPLGTMLFERIEHWRGKEIRELKPFTVPEIPKAYLDYPVKKVTVYFTFKCDDQINNGKPIFTMSQDVTNSWKQASGRIKQGKTDCCNFMDLVRRTN